MAGGAAAGTWRASSIGGSPQPGEARLKSGWIVSGRGELHLAILIERMRREVHYLQNILNTFSSEMHALRSHRHDGQDGLL